MARGRHQAIDATGTNREIPEASRPSVSWWLGLAGAAIAGVSAAVLYTKNHAAADSLSYRHSGWDEAWGVTAVLSGVAMSAAGLVAWRRRKGSFAGPLMIALGIDLGLFVVVNLSETDLGTIAEPFVYVLLRPLLYWLVLGWPTGRLDRGDRRLLTGYAIATTVLTFLVMAVTAEEPGVFQPYQVAEVPTLSEGLHGVNVLVLIQLGAVVVLIAVVRRHSRLSREARRLARPALVAAGVATVADMVLFSDRFITESLNSSSGLRPLGYVVYGADVGRFGVIGVVLVWSILRVRRSERPRLRRLDLGSAGTPGTVRDRLAVALGDPRLEVAFRRGDHWIGLDGQPRLLRDDAERRVTRVHRGDELIAAIEHDALLEDRPALLETATAAAALALEHERLEALAAARLDELTRARLAILEAEDAARRRLERDLHDGAQQQLVGLALQARLAAASGASPADQAAVREGVAAARLDLASLADGILPAVLAEKGLLAAVETIASTAPLATNVQIRLPADLDAGDAATTWFVVSEAVANTVKHAAASALDITVTATDRDIEIVVSDDGIGGVATTGGVMLRALRDRVEGAGGSLEVVSPAGAGTRVHARIPRVDAVEPVGQPA